MEQYLIVVLGSIVVIVISRLLEVLLNLIWRPYVIAKWYRKQGLQGPEYKFMKGSIDEIKHLISSAQKVPMDINSHHDFTPRVLPHYLKWMFLYGRMFIFWYGPVPEICINDMELIKQVLLNKSGFYWKIDQQPALLALLGNGLGQIDGPDWVRHRRVLNPAFNIDKLKMMTRSMTECVKFMIEGWENNIAQDKNKQIEMELNNQFLELTADIISHTAFGSSYIKGKEVFSAQRELQILAFETIFNARIPGFQYLPTAKNRKMWGLEKKVWFSLTQIIRERMKSRTGEFGNDLLGLMLESCMDGGKENDKNRFSMDEIIDECKTFFFGGHETTSHLMTWTIFLLSINQDWQQKLREEVLNVCGFEVPTADMLAKLKLVNMVLLEALRLYGPVSIVVRKASQDIKLGTIKLLKGTHISIPIAILHRDKEIWGSDANEFKPLRFQNGISKAANHPNAFLSFIIGPRACIGQNFAMLEAKAVIAMILQKFSFSNSPSYVHQPVSILTLQPASGLQVIIRPIKV